MTDNPDNLDVFRVRADATYLASNLTSALYSLGCYLIETGLNRPHKGFFETGQVEVKKAADWHPSDPGIDDYRRARIYLRLMAKALAPFAAFADGCDKMPADLQITAGSSFAKPQLTMQQCRDAAAVLEAHNQNLPPDEGREVALLQETGRDAAHLLDRISRVRRELVDKTVLDQVSEISRAGLDLAMARLSRTLRELEEIAPDRLRTPVGDSDHDDRTR